MLTSLQRGLEPLCKRAYRLVRLPKGPPELLSRSHSWQSGLPPVPCRTFSGAMLLPVWQLRLLW
jgi:hypothetical protein